MSSSETPTYSRRQFIHTGLGFISLAATAPLFIQRSAHSALLPFGGLLSSVSGVPEDHVLVVVQLAGGNDGLNTVVPFGVPAYYRARPGIAVPEPGGAGNNNQNAALTIDKQQGIGLHPNFAGFRELLDEGVASIVQGVGYPNPNRSHFTSMDIWHTADPSGSARGPGWIGRYFDCTCNGRPEPEAAISIGRETPLAMEGEIQKPINFDNAELFRWLGEESDRRGHLTRAYDKINRAGDLTGPGATDTQLGFLTRTALDAQVSSDRIRAAVAKRPLVQYPGGQLSRQLQTVAAMIRDGLKTRVYYVSLGGFDTHAAQVGVHSNLMRQLGDSLNAFYKDLKAQGNQSRVLTMCFSEFGRRVAQNASGGTDHGTAAPMYFVGDMVRPGLVGDHPSLTDLEDGDLKFTLDFRSVYASVLEDWLAAPSQQVLGQKFRPARILQRGKVAR